MRKIILLLICSITLTEKWANGTGFGLGDGSKIKTELGWIPAYKMDPSDNLPLISKKYIKYSKNLLMSPVIDAFMDGEGVGILNTAIQEMMLGTKSPQDVVTEYENWAAANDRNCK